MPRLGPDLPCAVCNAELVCQARAGPEGLLLRFLYLRTVTHAAGLCLVSGLSHRRADRWQLACSLGLSVSCSLPHLCPTFHLPREDSSPFLQTWQL